MCKRANAQDRPVAVCGQIKSTGSRIAAFGLDCSEILD
jgi:hypothetical protein